MILTMTSMESRETHAEEFYRYESLDACLQHAIRLLTVQPGDLETIQCQISYANLKSNPTFKAISYTWGTEDRDRRISINGAVFLVRPNLHSVSHKTAEPTMPTIIWIDTICVNQADLEERKHQVSLMSMTYSQAEGVIAWLGDDSDGALTSGINVAISELVHSIAQLYLFPPHRENLTSYLSSFKSDFSPAAQTALLALSFRSYWSRTWIIQELNLARRRVLWFGSHGSMPFEPLRDWAGPHEVASRPFRHVLGSMSFKGLVLGVPP